MKELVLLFAVVALFTAGCSGDARCPKVADAVARIALSEAAKRFAADSPEMKALTKQVEAQKEKVAKQCNAMLKQNASPAWEAWADCMPTVSTAEEAMKCKKPSGP